jgi:hypothetical protein
MKAILHLPILIDGKQRYILHVTHMFKVAGYLKFRNFANNQVLILDVSRGKVRFVDYTSSSVYEDGVTVG